MNPAIQRMYLAMVAELVAAVLTHDMERDDGGISNTLMLFVALMHHGIVTHSIEELRDIAIADFKSTIGPRIRGGSAAALQLAAEVGAKVITEALTQGLADYREQLFRQNIDPNTLPKVESEKLDLSAEYIG